MNPSLDDLKRLEKESQHLYDNAHDDMSDYFKDVLELIFTHERLMQSHEQLQIDAKKDYEDMRKFQLKFIESDHKRIDLEDKLDKACAALEEYADMDHSMCITARTTLAEIRKKDDNG